MKIILKKAVTGIGGPGTVKEVADGYARNFLIARGIAVMATTGQLQEMAAKAAAKAKGSALAMAKLAEVLVKLPEVNLVFKRKATPTGKLFAAISAEMIAEELSKAVKLEVSPDLLVVTEPIKSLGEHIVKLHSGDKLGEFKVTVEKE
ncbi:50S ribosomal protein L9 [candidate division Kazan bacterium RIFCSPHIGHO2_01_FULL_49_10]|uniref:Large ribosomal subunit protein bL9 n=1 Tax=candidate division Kazan bacterium RIFCSPLOWO2_01_FULL_48_13 TaxID=1798539 RepID=A0A1F4PNB1_UNCK3|nr:MAG: 50S ribosomal protein L9 [candidate division Kazan bacterium RIFCSPHIGHO2_01_FULL_49_10]OGB85144.1 MAG: 50S ribosomal protein L9 [candidate division Kazan bacterium RIFCSPLOWO2_01_FULL_48_13]